MNDIFLNCNSIFIYCFACRPDNVYYKGNHAIFLLQLQQVVFLFSELKIRKTEQLYDSISLLLLTNE